MNLPNLPTLDAASRKRWSDAKRILVMLACGLITLRGSTPLAQLLGMPEIAWLGMLIGTGFASAAASHVARRLFFPRLDLQALAVAAARNGQAGQVVLGICIVLAALVLAMGSARAASLPPGAVQHLPTLQAEIAAHWPAADLPTLLGRILQARAQGCTLHDAVASVPGAAGASSNFSMAAIVPARTGRVAHTVFFDAEQSMA